MKYEKITREWWHKKMATTKKRLKWLQRKGLRCMLKTHGIFQKNAPKSYFAAMEEWAEKRIHYRCLIPTAQTHDEIRAIFERINHHNTSGDEILGHAVIVRQSGFGTFSVNCTELKSSDDFRWNKREKPHRPRNMEIAFFFRYCSSKEEALDLTKKITELLNSNLP